MIYSITLKFNFFYTKCIKTSNKVFYSAYTKTFTYYQRFKLTISHTKPTGHGRLATFFDEVVEVGLGSQYSEHVYQLLRMVEQNPLHQETAEVVDAQSEVQDITLVFVLFIIICFNCCIFKSYFL